MIQARFTSKRRRDGEYDTPPPTQSQPPPHEYRELEQGLATPKRYRPDWIEELRRRRRSQLLLPKEKMRELQRSPSIAEKS